MYYTEIKHSSHLRTLEKCRKHSPAARAFYISLVFSNACRVLSQCNTRLRLLYLLNKFQLSSRFIMLVLSRTVWAKNSLLITVVDEVFSLVKISGKLYKSCMCLILSQSRRCLYIALSLSVSACSCVRTSRVLFVLPMYEELQPGQMNS